MTKTTTPERETHFKRVGGYKGPAKLDVIDVPCGTCGAAIGAKCEGVSTFHKTRREWRKTLLERADGDTSTARWWRMRIRNGQIAAPPQGCGTYGAYQRHRRNGEVIDAACEEAARAEWRKNNAARRAK